MTIEGNENSPRGTSVLLTSRELPYEQTVSRIVEFGDRKVNLEAFSRKGLSYWREKKASEDACVVLRDDSNFQAIVVDGGTQIEKVSTLDEAGLTGGRYIATKVEQFGAELDPAKSMAVNLRILNAKIGEDVKAHHPSVTYEEHSKNTPYGSVAGVRFDFQNGTLEVANAGDVFVIAVKKNRIPMILTVDDVYVEDQKSFAAARRLADKYGVPFRFAMQNRDKDPRFNEVARELEETMRQGNIGKIRRITGAPNFDVTSSVMVSLSEIENLYIFTDGGVPPGFTISERDGVYRFLDLVEQSFEKLSEEIKKEMMNDPDYERYPRFGSLDDLMIIKISL